MEDIRIGNDIKVLWRIVTGDGEQPYGLEEKKLSLYMRHPFGKIEITDFSVKGNALEFMFWGKDQKYTGCYAFTLVENDGIEGMHTVDACDAFCLVSCSCKAGGDADSKVELVHLELKGTMVIGGTSVQIDKELSPDSENAIANNAVYREFDAVKRSVKDILTIAPLSGNGVIAAAFEQYALAEKVGTPIACLIKQDGFEKYYTNAILTVEQYDGIGYRLNFCILNAVSDAVSPDDMETIYKPDCVLGDGKTLAYLYNPESGYVIPLGEGRVNLDLRRDNVIPRDIIIDLDDLGYSEPMSRWTISGFEQGIGMSVEDLWRRALSCAVKVGYEVSPAMDTYEDEYSKQIFFDMRSQSMHIKSLSIIEGYVGFGTAIPAEYFTTGDKTKLNSLKNYDDTEVKNKLEEFEEAIKALQTTVASLQNNS